MFYRIRSLLHFRFILLVRKAKKRINISLNFIKYANKRKTWEITITLWIFPMYFWIEKKNWRRKDREKRLRMSDNDPGAREHKTPHNIYLHFFYIKRTRRIDTQSRKRTVTVCPLRLLLLLAVAPAIVAYESFLYKTPLYFYIPIGLLLLPRVALFRISDCV